MTFSPHYDLPIDPSKKKVLYRGKPYFILCNNYNGTVDLYEKDVVSYVGESCYYGVERSIEKDELVIL